MDAIERHVTLPTDLEGAWDLLTRPEDQAGWLGAEVDLDPTEGSEGLVVDHDGTRRRLVVDRVDEGRELVWSWWVEGDDPDERDGGQASEVQVTLRPTFDGTLVTVTERPLTTAARASAATSTGAWSLRMLHLEALPLFAAVAVRG